MLLKDILRKIKFNLRKDLFDKRDRRFKDLWKESDLPEVVDLRAQHSPIEDQLTIGSCGPNALVGNLEYLDIAHGKSLIDLSRLFIYYNTRHIMGTLNEDSGVSMRDLIKAVARYGVCSENSWPYIPTKFRERPGTSCYIGGLSRRITEYLRLDGSSKDQTKRAIQSCLADNYPVIFGLNLHKSFMSEKVAATGLVPVPRRFFDKSIGGHAMEIVGYDTKVDCFIVRNSWGPTWGIEGYCCIPMSYVLKEGSDFWTIRK